MCTYHFLPFFPRNRLVLQKETWQLCNDRACLLSCLLAWACISYHLPLSLSRVDYPLTRSIPLFLHSSMDQILRRSQNTVGVGRPGWLTQPPAQIVYDVQPFAGPGLEYATSQARAQQPLSRLAYERPTFDACSSLISTYVYTNIQLIISSSSLPLFQTTPHPNPWIQEEEEEFQSLPTLNRSPRLTLNLHRILTTFLPQNPTMSPTSTVHPSTT